MKLYRHKKHNYVYILFSSDGRLYIGVRGCDCEPAEDWRYRGSFKDRYVSFLVIKKVILKNFGRDRPAAHVYESYLHRQNNVVVNPKFANKCIALPNGFSISGLKHSLEQTLAMERYWTPEKRAEESTRASRQMSSMSMKIAIASAHGAKPQNWFHVSGETFSGFAVELMEKYNLPNAMSAVVRGKSKALYGWSLAETNYEGFTIEKVKSRGKVPQNWLHISGEQFYGYVFELIAKYNLEKKHNVHLNEVSRGKRSVAYGWHLSELDIKEVRKESSNKIRESKIKRQVYCWENTKLQVCYFGQQNDFCEAYKLSAGTVGRLNNHPEQFKHCQNWRLVACNTKSLTVA